MTPSEPPSPCTRACTLDPETDICLGCHRTLAEIMNWSNYSVAEKLTVLEQSERRKVERMRKLESWRSQKNSDT